MLEPTDFRSLYRKPFVTTTSFTSLFLIFLPRVFLSSFSLTFSLSVLSLTFSLSVLSLSLVLRTSCKTTNDNPTAGRQRPLCSLSLFSLFSFSSFSLSLYSFSHFLLCKMMISSSFSSSSSVSFIILVILCVHIVLLNAASVKPGKNSCLPVYSF